MSTPPPDGLSLLDATLYTDLLPAVQAGALVEMVIRQVLDHQLKAWGTPSHGLRFIDAQRATTSSSQSGLSLGE